MENLVITLLASNILCIGVIVQQRIRLKEFANYIVENSKKLEETVRQIHLYIEQKK